LTGTWLIAGGPAKPAAPGAQAAPIVPIAPGQQSQNAPVVPNPNQPNLDELLKKFGGNFSFPIHINNRSLCQATLVASGVVGGVLTCTGASASHCFSGRGGSTDIRTPANFFGRFTAKVSIAPGSRGQGIYHDAAFFTFTGAACRKGQTNQVPPIPMLPANKKIPVGSQVFWASSREANHGGKIFKGRVKNYSAHTVTVDTYNRENNARGRNWGGIEGDSGGGLFYREMINGVPQYYLVGVCSTRDNQRVNGMTGFRHLDYHNGPGFRWMRNFIAKMMGPSNLPNPNLPPGTMYAQNPNPATPGAPGATGPNATPVIPYDPTKPRAATINASLNYTTY
jgi:hypothetical protein